MHPADQRLNVARDAAQPPPWYTVLRALRAARGATQEGWAMRLGVSRATVQRWERGERAPDPGAEAAILSYCHDAGLLRSFGRGPLAGLTLSEEGLRELFAAARWGGDGEVRSRHQDAADGVPPTNLPVQLTSFVGRAAELAAVRRVQATTRLLTLSGPGGCGKTRLGLALAAERLGAYPHGVWFVDLAPHTDPALVPQAIAAALGLRPTGPQPLSAALTEALAPRQLLLLLDNCEQLLPGCAAFVETLLRTCPHLAILATSRESLGSSGETVWRVPPLALPPCEPGGAQPERREAELAGADAVQLFVERARLQRPAWSPTPAELRVVVAICRRLDGIPLAIELAAARVHVLSLAQLAARLDDRFRLLTGGRTVLPRQQTLRAALDWSYALLSAAERMLLQRLAVFAGGWTLEAAEQVCAGDGVAAAAVLDLLTRLVDKSLVIAEEQRGAVRYRLLETLRQYAAEQRSAAGEGTATQERHAAWAVALVEEGWQHCQGPAQDAWLERLTREHDNLRAALGWCLADADAHAVTVGLRLAGRLRWFWEMRGDLSEGRRWLAALLARGDAAPPDVRATALLAAGMLANGQGDYDAAVQLYEQSLALARERGDTAAVARTLNSLAITAGMRGDQAAAQTLLEETLAVERKLGDRWMIAGALANLGNVAAAQGEIERAIAHYEESLALAQELDDRHLVAILLQNLGNRYRDQRAWELAAARYHEALSVFRVLGDQLGILRCLRVIAGLSVDRSDAARAARLGGAAAALRERLGVALAASGDAAFARSMAAACAALGETAFAAEWAAGQALAQEQAVAEALAATRMPSHGSV